MSEYKNEFLEKGLGVSFYKELYHLNGSHNTVVLDETTGYKYVRKKLKYFDINIFEYLKNHNHPNIPRIHEYHLDNDELIVYEEFIDGITLEEFISRSPSDKQLEKIVVDVCKALQFLHSSNPSIIHRDIKCSNILISRDGTTKLIDFDAAKFVNSKSDRDTVLLGTEGYAAPEQYGFGSSDIRTDVYGVGKLIATIFPNRAAYMQIVNKATQMDPNKRYHNIKSLLIAFNSKGMLVFTFPGFRGEGVFHKTVSCIGYFIALLLILNIRFEDYSESGNNLAKVILILMVIIIADLLSGVSPFWTRMPITKSTNDFVKVFGALIYSFIVFVLSFILIAFLVQILGL